MLSLNIVDLLDKVLSFPNKDRETSLVKYSGVQNLMNGKLDMYQHMSYSHDQNLVENGWINPEYSMFDTSNLNTKVNNGIHRIIGQSCKRAVPKVTFSHYVKGISDSHRYPVEPSDMLFNLTDYLNFISNFICDKTIMNSAIMTDLTVDPNISYKDITDFNIQNLTEENMNEHIRNSKSKIAHSYENVTKSDMTGKIQELSGNHKLNQQLANRKAKELQKRSKKRRRRQKKVRHPNLEFESYGNTEKVKTDTSEAAVDVVDSICKPPKNSSHLSDCKHCKRNDVNCDTTSCCSKNIKKKDDFILDIVSVQDAALNTVQICLPDFSSFLISVESVGDDDSDWDTSSEADWLPITTDFDFPGLFVTNLTASVTNSYLNDLPTVQCVTLNCSDDLEELKKLESILKEVNRNWNEATKEIDKKPKLPSKVSFAPDNELVEVKPVEIYDRKGEWERYATERMRFRRRIDELEKVLSPCLSTDHRSKIFELYHPQL